MSSSNPPKNIVIVGTSYTGVGLAHKLLKYGLPEDYGIVLVGPTSSLYWNCAAPRAVAKQATFGKDDSPLFKNFIGGFAAYGSQFRYIQAMATQLAPNENKIEIEYYDEEGQTKDQREFITYEHLCLCTGARTYGDWPFKNLGSATQTEKTLKEKRVLIQAAHSIVISGAGPTGVELAGEIATYYPNKMVTLISADDSVLSKVTHADVGKTAAQTLKSLGVVIRTGTKVVADDDKNGKRVLTLSNNEKIETDLHIPAYGLIPNTSYIPKELLDKAGWIKCNSHLQAQGHSNIWVAGDVAADVQYRQLNNIADMTEVVKQNIYSVIKYADEELDLKEWNEEDAPLLVPIGSRFAKGTGLVLSKWFKWKPWGLVVWLLKGRQYGINYAESIATGKSMPAMKKV